MNRLWLCAGLILLTACKSTNTQLSIPEPSIGVNTVLAQDIPPIPPDNTDLVDAEGLDFAEKRVIDVYNHVSPSVVSVTTKVLQYGFFRDVIEQEGSGSGFVLDTKGHILTNYHVVQDARPEKIEVTFGDDTTLSAKLIGVDPRNDMAVLQVDASAEVLKPVELGSSSALQVGQRAIAIGNPFGEFSRTLTTGVVSALNRTITGPEDLDITGIIQTDASINKGNSGGPLLDSAGRVIGINSAIYSPTGTSAGVGFAVPVDTIKRVVPDLIAYGHYRRPWLGLGPRSAYSISPRFAQVLNLGSSEGLLLVQVDGPIAQAGVKGAQQQVVYGNRLYYVGGDILLAIDGQKVRDFNALATLLETHYKIGDEVELSIVRGNKAQKIKLSLSQEPSP
jgi:S1-C subfamily serine protease